jgi:excisionase family DNA binding protein
MYNLGACQDSLYTFLVAEPVGIKEIAERLGVQRATVDRWLQRHLLPAPPWTVGGRPCWDWPAIEAWARATGRLHTDGA